jgi:hypothetical protein
VNKLTLAEAISAFGAEAKAKLSNSAATGQPEDQLRAPLEKLFQAFAELTGKSGMVTLVGGPFCFTRRRKGAKCGAAAFQCWELLARV